MRRQLAAIRALTHSVSTVLHVHFRRRHLLPSSSSNICRRLSRWTKLLAGWLLLLLLLMSRRCACATNFRCCHGGNYSGNVFIKIFTCMRSVCPASAACWMRGYGWGMAACVCERVNVLRFGCGGCVCVRSTCHQICVCAHTHVPPSLYCGQARIRSASQTRAQMHISIMKLSFSRKTTRLFISSMYLCCSRTEYRL